MVRVKALRHQGEQLRYAPFMMLLLAAVLLVGLGGCNTMRGMGEDVEAAGETMSGTAAETEEELEN